MPILFIGLFQIKEKSIISSINLRIEVVLI